MSQKLCEKCRASVGSIEPLDWVHCHHDEEEKPKEKCWCDEDVGNKLNWRFWYHNKSELIPFCPFCGKPIEEWGK